MDILWHVGDCIFPLARPLSKEERQREITLAEGHLAYCEECLKNIPAGNEEAVLARYLAGCKDLLESEDSRRQGVEVRLTSILGLFTIAGTIVFGGLVALALGTLHAPNGFTREDVSVAVEG